MFKPSFSMVLKIGKFFTRSKSWANALQDENNRGWANNLQGKQFAYFERHKLIHKRLLCKKQQYINMVLKKLLYFVFEKNKVYRLAYFTRNNLKL